MYSEKRSIWPILGLISLYFGIFSLAIAVIIVLS